MPPHKSEDYKISAVQYYLSNNIFKGVYERPEKYKPKNKTSKTIYKVGVLNFHFKN